MNDLHSINTIFKQNVTLMRNALVLFCVFCLIFSVFAVVIYRTSRHTLEAEFTAASAQEIANLTNYLDNSIMEMRYLASSLETNELTKFLFSTTDPESIFSGYQKQINDILIALQYSRKAIDGIYIYSGLSELIYSVNAQAPITRSEESAWLDMLAPDEYGFSVFPYTMRSLYPYELCVAKSFTVNGIESSIAIMLNLSKLPEISSIAAESNKRFYLVSAQDEILYRAQQKSMPESLDAVPLLQSYLNSADNGSQLKHDGSEYVLSIQKSDKYDWFCILTSDISGYTKKLSTQNAIMLAILSVAVLFALFFSVFFSLQSFKPIRDIRSFLERPDLFTASTKSMNADIEYISQRTIQLMQKNEQLRQDLSSYLTRLNDSQQLALQSQINPHFLFNTLNMMYVQATDSLGYDHILPQMILDTGSLFRYAIDTTQMVTFDTELSYTDIYLQILSLRYENNLIVEKDICEDSLKAKVPRLFIQPILENAVFHGFSERFSSICILTMSATIDTSTSDTQLVLSIRDNGCGIEPEKLQELRATLASGVKRKSIGLQNVVERMKLIYGEDFSLSIESKVGSGTCFTLRFPYISE